MTTMTAGMKWEGSQSGRKAIRVLVQVQQGLENTMNWTPDDVEAYGYVKHDGSMVPTPFEATARGARIFSLQGWVKYSTHHLNFDPALAIEVEAWLVQVCQVITGQAVTTPQEINAQGWGMVAHIVDMAIMELKASTLMGSLGHPRQ